MTKLYLTLLRMLDEELGQDLVEYALLAGFIVVAGGMFVPISVAGSISQLFSRLASVVNKIAL